ncbi:MAG: family 10 glycosylhydrolase [Gemmataceae bacterium]
MIRKAFALLFLFIIVHHLRADTPASSKPEFRGVWVATVANIDWPSKPGLSAEIQKQELIALLDRCKQLNLNAVIFQIRPMCDALYESKLEPWSGFLTGQQGRNPGYDPLALAVTEAHRRGLELHCWFNPYRAWHPSCKGEPASNHIVKSRPDMARKYGKHFWLVPTHPDVPRHSLAVVLDVVKRYDIDGIHMDDYFYPYPELDENKKEIPFPDDETWDAYRKQGGTLARDDWRRAAVNLFVKTLYQETHQCKPWVKVGISPFGIWRPGYPPGIKGFDQYARLYADAKLWLNVGWVDYFTPQLYWPIDKPEQSYPKLLDWWASQNTKNRHLWVGNYTGKWSAEEIGKQIEITRSHGQAGGNVHFSMKSLKGDRAKALGRLYAEPAAVPETPWLKKRP